MNLTGLVGKDKVECPFLGDRLFLVFGNCVYSCSLSRSQLRKLVICFGFRLLSESHCVVLNVDVRGFAKPAGPVWEFWRERHVY